MAAKEITQRRACIHNWRWKWPRKTNGNQTCIIRMCSYNHWYQWRRVNWN